MTNIFKQARTPEERKACFEIMEAVQDFQILSNRQLSKDLGGMDGVMRRRAERKLGEIRQAERALDDVVNWMDGESFRITEWATKRHSPECECEWEAATLYVIGEIRALLFGKRHRLDPDRAQHRIGADSADA